MVRGPYTDKKTGVKKGKWSEDEDKQLRAFVQEHGHGNWRQLPGKAGLHRCGKSCRLRWENYLKPGVRRGNYSPEEDELIIKLHEQYGNSWSKITSQFPGRTDNDIKNHWNAHLMKKRVLNIKMKTIKPSSSTTYENNNISGSCRNDEDSPSSSSKSSITTFGSMQQQQIVTSDHELDDDLDFITKPLNPEDLDHLRKLINDDDDDDADSR